jgi:transposase-like protein
VRIPICHCSRCHSGNTIRVHEELLREHWYCYDCGRSFDVPIVDSGQQAHHRVRAGGPLGVMDQKSRSVRQLR